MVCNPDERASVNIEWFRNELKREQKEAQRRRMAYLADEKAISPTNKTAIIVDDGIATGLTMRAAILDIKSRKPNKIIVAVPIAPLEIVKLLTKEVDEFIALEIPDPFLGSVGSYYLDFPQVSDEEVITLLKH
jgi:predicted phosphoribosyltransferase